MSEKETLLEDMLSEDVSWLIETKLLTAGEIGILIHKSERHVYRIAEGDSPLKASQWIVLAREAYLRGSSRLLERILPTGLTLAKVTNEETNGTLDDEVVEVNHYSAKAREDFEAGRYDKTIEDADNLERVAERMKKEAIEKKGKKK